MLFLSGPVMIDCEYCKPLQMAQYRSPAGLSVPARLYPSPSTMDSSVCRTVGKKAGLRLLHASRSKTGLFAAPYGNAVGQNRRTLAERGHLVYTASWTEGSKLKFRLRASPLAE